MKYFSTAIRFLTIFSWTATAEIAPEAVGRATAFFPFVGFGLGFIVVLLNWLIDPYLASEIVSVVLIAFLILLTRAQHLEGLKLSFDQAFGGRDRAAGISGLLAVLIVVALKFRAVEVMGDSRTEGLLLAPVLGRWAMVVLAYGSEPGDDGVGRALAHHLRVVHLLLASAIAIALVAAFAGRTGLWVALWVSLVALLGRGIFHRCLGGVSEDSLGAVEEVSEALALVLFASL